MKTYIKLIRKKRVDEEGNLIVEQPKIPEIIEVVKVKSKRGRKPKNQQLTTQISSPIDTKTNANIVKKEPDTMYFSDLTQKKIMEYKSAIREDEKSKIYFEFIYPAFETLVNKLISVYNFKSFDEELQHMKKDCIFFLFETIHKWDESKGKRAFSYFNVVAKNWLIMRSKQNYNYSKRNVQVEDSIDFLNKSEMLGINDKLIDPKMPDDEIVYHEKFLGILDMIDYIEDKVHDERDKKCIDTIRVVFQNIDNLEFLNKKALFIYMREISGLNSNELSASLSNIRKHYKYYKELEDDDKIDWL